MSMLLSCQSLSKTYGTRPLFLDVSMGVSTGERLGMIGPNGSGKSTLLKILAGIEPPDTGEMTQRRDLHIGYVAQADAFPLGATALGVVTTALLPQTHDEHEAEIKAAVTLDRVGFIQLDQPAAELSGGWKKRLSIAREIARDPDLLFLDEPTNHLDLEGILWLENLLRNSPFAMICVTHDRYFLEAVATRVIELSRAYPQGSFTVDGPYSTFLRRRDEFLEAQAREEQALASKVRQDMAWLGRGAQARRTKAKGRIQDAGERMEELKELRQRNTPTRAAGIEFDATGRQTRNLLVAQSITKQLGDRPLFSGLDLTLSPGSCLGLLGPNGSGKTSLIRILTGELAPDTGTVKRADSLRVVTFTQHREALDPKQSLRDALCPISDRLYYRGVEIHITSWASRFLFTPEQMSISVGDLSGGEQARILISQLMLQPADLLILDEPTNDLDIPSLEILEESLSDFPGAVVLVTHDRFMLDRLSTQVLYLDGRGGTHFYPDYSQWESTRARREAEFTASTKPAKPAPPPPPPEPSTAPASTKSKRLSYNEQREWDQMEANIMAAEEKAKVFEAKMNEPAVLADRRKMEECCRELDAAHALVQKLYARWAELEEKQK